MNKWIAILILIGGCQRKVNPPKNCAPGQVKVEENCLKDPNRAELPPSSGDSPSGDQGDSPGPSNDDTTDPSNGSGTYTNTDPTDDSPPYRSSENYSDDRYDYRNGSIDYNSDRYDYNSDRYDYNSDRYDYDRNRYDYDRNSHTFDDVDDSDIVNRPTETFRDLPDHSSSQEDSTPYKDLKVFITLKATASPNGIGPMGLFLKLSTPQLVSKISLQYLKSEVIEGESAFKPWDVNAAITFKVENKTCEINSKRFDWETYRPNENSFGKLTPYTCKETN